MLLIFGHVLKGTAGKTAIIQPLREYYTLTTKQKDATRNQKWTIWKSVSSIHARFFSWIICYEFLKQFPWKCRSNWRDLIRLSQVDRKPIWFTKNASSLSWICASHNYKFCSMVWCWLSEKCAFDDVLTKKLDTNWTGFIITFWSL